VKKRSILFLILIAVSLQGLQAQVTQTLLGQLLDKATQQPLPGVVVQIPGLSPQKATVTDSAGYYKLENIPAGRIDINFSLTGYQPVHLSKIYISGGKEVNINIELEEKTTDLKEVTISAKSKCTQFYGRRNAKICRIKK
jgi:CarboxypepD_reg-like domain